MLILMGRGSGDNAGIVVIDRSALGARSSVPVKDVDTDPSDKWYPSVVKASSLAYKMARRRAETDQARITEREEILKAGVLVSHDPWLTNRLLAVYEGDQEQLDNVAKIRSSSEPVIVTNVIGEESHWLNGKLHREDGPAIIYKSNSLGRQSENGRLQLEALSVNELDTGLIALNDIYPGQGQAWYKDGKPYRENGEPAVIDINGVQKQVEFREYWQADDLKGASFRRDTYDIPYTGDKGKYKHNASEWVKVSTDGAFQFYRENGPTQIGANGTEIWSVQVGDQSVFHREDGPAYISKDEVAWHRKGKLHREDGPAKIFSDGRQEWHIDGKRHREDGPAVIAADGQTEWWSQGERHREGGPARTNADGTIEYWQRGKLHREDGPAIVREDGTKEWYLEGELHREDGPAVEDAEGWGQWYDHGQPISAKRSRFSAEGEPAWWEQVESGSKIDD